MARPLRIEFSGAIHHVMARGNVRQPIFLDDEGRVVYESGHRQLPQIGTHFGLHYSTCVKAQDLTPTFKRSTNTITAPSSTAARKSAQTWQDTW